MKSPSPNTFHSSPIAKSFSRYLKFTRDCKFSKLRIIGKKHQLLIIMRDIETREDIREVVTDFYKKAVDDELIGYIFTDVAEIDLEHHLPIITDFWEMLLLGTVNFQAKYRRSPMQIHHALNEKENLKPE